MNNAHVNPFVQDLIKSQQDGRGAISGPMNWAHPPLLEVSTPESDEETESLLRDMTPNSGSQGRWHWLIGSPGNGKSAQMGKVARRLNEAGYELTNEDGELVSIQALTQTPYLLGVRERDKRFPFAMLVQDASVVRSPFEDTCDPAQDLLKTITKASDRGRSLLVCTNWGVLHRVFDLAHNDPNLRAKPWFSAVKQLAHPNNQQQIPPVTSDGKKTVFNVLKVTSGYLDHESLLGESDLFERLLEKATSQDRWQACEGCPAITRCPLKANRDDLSTPEIRQNVLSILRRAEALDGQVIVFREAVALVSLLLAGCPNDHRGKSPCEWVQDRHRSGELFQLLARRIPLLLFGSSSGCGLEPLTHRIVGQKGNRQEQRESLEGLASSFGAGQPVTNAISGILRQDALSTNVGVGRLVGPSGAITRLDPSLDPRNARALAEFDPAAVNAGEGPAGIRQIERDCLEIWSEMLDKVAEKEGAAEQGYGMYFWLKRWQETCISWLAGTSLGLTAFQAGLEEYVGIFQVSADRKIRRASMKRTEKNLNGLLAPQSEEGSRDARVELASSMFLTGDWAKKQLHPKLEGEISRYGKLCVKMGGNEFVVTAETFVWLKRRDEVGLSDVSFNPDVLDALKRAHAQAAATSDYAVENDDVTITVVDHNGDNFAFERIGGYLVSVGER